MLMSSSVNNPISQRSDVMAHVSNLLFLISYSNRRGVIWYRARPISGWAAVAWSWSKTRRKWSGWVHRTRLQLNEVAVQSLTLPNATVQFSTVVCGWSRSCAQPVMVLPAAANQLDQSSSDIWNDQGFHRHSARLLNDTLVGVNSQLLQKVQLIQNAAAARLVTGTRKYERMTPVFRDLHWLPVRQQITYKTALLVYKCLYVGVPYDVRMSQSGGCSHLQSADLCQLSVPRTRTNQGPSTWNSLFAALRTQDISLDSFAKRLKTFVSLSLSDTVGW